jgi:hypothetical protein
MVVCTRQRIEHTDRRADARSLLRHDTSSGIDKTQTASQNSTTASSLLSSSLCISVLLTQYLSSLIYILTS